MARTQKLNDGLKLLSRIFPLENESAMQAQIRSKIVTSSFDLINREYPSKSGCFINNLFRVDNPVISPNNGDFFVLPKGRV
jgi:hypothetical protein